MIWWEKIRERKAPLSALLSRKRMGCLNFALEELHVFPLFSLTLVAGTKTVVETVEDTGYLSHLF